MARGRPVRTCEGVTFTPADPRPVVRRRRPRSGPVRTSWVEPAAPGPPVDAEQIAALRHAISAETTLAALGGEPGPSPLEAAVRSGVAGDHGEALRTMIEGGVPVADAFLLLLDLPEVTPSVLIGALVRPVGALLLQEPARR